MKRGALSLVFLLAVVGGFAQQINAANSTAYMFLAEKELIPTVSGGDGYYSRMLVSDDQKIVIYYFSIHNGIPDWAYTVLGTMENLIEAGENIYSYNVGGLSFVQGFTKYNGVNVIWITCDKINEGMSFLYVAE